jgi:hypothetical protein
MNSATDSTGFPVWFLTLTLDLECRFSRPGQSDLGLRFLKLLTALVVMLLAAVAILALWRAPVVLGLTLCLLALAKRILFPIKWELLWFLAVGYMGAYAESVIVQLGGAWSYAYPQFSGIPLWLPAIWGLTATSLMTAYAAVATGSLAAPHPLDSTRNSAVHPPGALPES